MKAIKKIIIVLVALVALVVVVSLFLPSEVTVTRTAEINTPADVVFGQVNDFKNWVNWDPWQAKDPDMVGTYSGPETGTDSKRCWESDNDEVGKGCLTITESVPGSPHARARFWRRRHRLHRPEPRCGRAARHGIRRSGPSAVRRWIR